MTITRTMPMWIVAVMLVLAAATPARAQDQIDRLIGRPVAAVEFQIEGRPDNSPAFIQLIDIKPGDLFTVESYRRVGQKFDLVPRFEGTSVNVVDRPDGLVLIVDARPKHPVNALRVIPANDGGLAPAELEQKIREEFNGLPALTRTADVEEAVRRIMRDEGYRSADAHATVTETHDPDRSTLEIAVQAGPRTIVSTVDIVGNSPLDIARTKARLGVTEGSPFRERKLTAELAAIRDELRAKQYYTAIAQHEQPTYSPDGKSVSLIVKIEAGPLVEVRVNGELPGRYDDYIPVKRENSVSRDLLEDAVAEIEKAWKRQGFWRVQAKVTSESPSPDRQIITFDINKGKRYRIVRVELPKDDPLIVANDFAIQKALQPNAIFDERAVINALTVVNGFFQQRGYHKVTSHYRFDEVPLPNSAEGGVIIHPNIVEGPQAIVTDIRFDLADTPGTRVEVTADDLQQQMLSKKGQPYGLANLVKDQRNLPEYFLPRGFLERRVSINPVSNDAGTEVVLMVYAREGPKITVSDILIVGNEKVSVETIRRELTLQVGQPYSERARLESQTKVSQLGIFRSVRVSLEEWLPGETSARVVVAVEEAKSKAYEFGGGVEGGSYPHTLPEGGLENRIIIAPRASIGYSKQNIGGRNRNFNAFGRLSFKPKTNDESGDISPDYRAIATYRERYAFGLKSDLLLSATAEQGLRTTYNFIKRTAGAEFLRPLQRNVTVSARYTLEWSRRFDEIIPPDQQVAIDRLYPQVRISMFSSGMVWDRRDDPLVTSHGGLISINGDLALKAFGSEVGFVKTFAEATWFRPLVGPKSLIFAVRGQIGLARGFDPSNTLEDALDDPFRDLPASQRFFSGGSSTNRAFQLDRLGTPEVLTPDGLSKGGNGLVLFNVELRQHITKLAKRDVTAVGFIDVGNIYHRVSDIDLSQLRTGVGFGVRYDSWIGPLRFDVGYKTTRMTFTGGPERRWEIHLSIGEVF